MHDHNSIIPSSDVLQQSRQASIPGLSSRPLLKYEQIALWAAQEWEQRYPDVPYRIVWAEEDCAHNMALKRIKPGRSLRRGARYVGYQAVMCPYSIPIDSFYVPSRVVVLTRSVGAYVFSFERNGQPFDVLFVSAHSSDDCGTAAIALVPQDQIIVWDAFERLCDNAAYRLERSEKVYIIGGMDKAFQPTVDWDKVILSEALKTDLRSDIETFFGKGVEIYKQLGLAPFRKLLFVGPPGTGKSTLCAALAKLALERKCIVVYVSSADEDGASFDKIQRALRIVVNSKHPVLLIVEDFDAYLKDEDKAQILNVLDGAESPNNPNGALLIATTNYPEKIDERIAKRPGRVDRIVRIPEIEDMDQAERMLRRYMGAQWQDDHRVVVKRLVGQTGAFVREVAVYARMLAANRQEPAVSQQVLEQSINSLTSQITSGHDLAPHRPVGFAAPEPQFSANQLPR